MIKKTVTIQNKTGLHARPAARFAKAAGQVQAAVTIVAGGRRINAKSIISLLGAGIAQGTRIELEVDGPDEECAVQMLTELIAGFDE